MYVVLVGTIEPPPFIGDTINVFSLQIVSACVIIYGLGFTVTTTENAGPEQLLLLIGITL